MPPSTPDKRKAKFDQQVQRENNSETRKMWLDAIFIDIEGKHSQALKIYQKVLKLEPDNPEYISGTANAFFGLGKTEDSFEILEAGLKRLPGHPTLIFDKVMNYIRLKDYTAAEQVIAELSASQKKGGSLPCRLFTRLSERDTQRV